MAYLHSFGRISAGEHALVRPEQIADLCARILPFGNGRSYGDTCLPPKFGSAVTQINGGDLAFDGRTGVLIAPASILIADIILHVGPSGWFVPVTPGTKFVTLGGAIANDVHGKNHHSAGSFGCHVAWFDLLRSDGVTYRCSRNENVPLFEATIGGMGLTGFILAAAIQMTKVPGCNILEQTLPFSSLSEYFDTAEAADAKNEYAVAWVDQLAQGNSAGRGLLFVGNHTAGEFVPHRRPTFSVPFVPPMSALNRLSVRAFNILYRTAKSRTAAAKITHYNPFFYPLDAIGRWNRLYGPNGLHQHQSVIPFEAAKTVIPQMLEQSRRARQVSFLTVIKRFGAQKSAGILSFARPGYTLTLDFPNKGASTLKLLDELDHMTIECGGAVNAYKDSRMSAATFEASFPNWRALEALRDPKFMSGFWERTAMQILSTRASG